MLWPTCWRRRGGGPRRDGLRGIEVGYQPRRVDGDQVVRILQKLIEPAGGGGVLGRVFAQVAVRASRCFRLGRGARGAGRFRRWAGASLGEQLVGEGLVEQPGDRAGAALGRVVVWSRSVGGTETGAKASTIGDAP